MIFSVVPADPNPVEPSKHQHRKDEPRSLVLFATDGAECVVVIDSIGSTAEYLRSECNEALLEELRAWKLPGFAIWSGYIRGSRSYEGEYDEEIMGECRALTADELDYLSRGEHVWDPEDWYQKDESEPVLLEKVIPGARFRKIRTYIAVTGYCSAIEHREDIIRALTNLQDVLVDLNRASPTVATGKVLHTTKDAIRRIMESKATRFKRG